MPDLFPNARRRPRRVLMRVVDAGISPFVTKFRHFVHLRCPKCEHDDGWSEYHTKREALTQPCPECNGKSA